MVTKLNNVFVSLFVYYLIRHSGQIAVLTRNPGVLMQILSSNWLCVWFQDQVRDDKIKTDLCHIEWVYDEDSPRIYSGAMSHLKNRKPFQRFCREKACLVSTYSKGGIVYIWNPSLRGSALWRCLWSSATWMMLYTTRKAEPCWLHSVAKPRKEFKKV